MLDGYKFYSLVEARAVGEQQPIWSIVDYLCCFDYLSAVLPAGAHEYIE